MDTPIGIHNAIPTTVIDCRHGRYSISHQNAGNATGPNSACLILTASVFNVSWASVPNRRARRVCNTVQPYTLGPCSGLHECDQRIDFRVYIRVAGVSSSVRISQLQET